MSPEPNLDFGRPAIFFDSHPQEQESYLYSYYTSLRDTLHIAFTGIVPKPLLHGSLRIIWYTHDGNQGLKDYGLHEYALVRENFDVLLDLEDVRRVVIMGFSGQNPFLYSGDGSAFGKAGGKRGAGGDRERRKRQEEIYVEEEEGRRGKKVDIEKVIEEHDKREEEKRKEAEERVWKEHEGLLSGQMV